MRYRRDGRFRVLYAFLGVQIDRIDIKAFGKRAIKSNTVAYHWSLRSYMFSYANPAIIKHYPSGHTASLPTL